MNRILMFQKFNIIQCAGWGRPCNVYYISAWVSAVKSTFHKKHVLYKICNRFTMKVSYSSLPYIKTEISRHNNNIAIFELEKFLSKKVVSVGWGADCTRWSLRICQVTVCLSSLSALTSFLFQSTSARAGPLLQGGDLLESGHLDQQQIRRQ